MAAPKWWVPYIKARARQMNLDPQAVLAIAQHEGLSGNAGDNNTSFGPFQLHRGGALPSGKGRAWAESRAGIDYALRSMSKVAGGLRGRAAVENISRRFERPANPGAEIADAMSHYGSYKGAGSLSGAPAGIPGGDSGSAGAAGGDFKQQMAQFLLQNAAQGGMTNPTDVLALAQMRQGMTDSQSTSAVAGVAAPLVAGSTNQKEAHAISTAKQYLGTWYKWGGESPKSGFDCSGLLQYSWAQSGVKIPRTSQQQWRAGKAVGKNALHPGDAVFFGSSSGPHHVGMYIGGGKFIEAPHTGAKVRVSNLAGRTDFVGARRYA